MTDQPKPTPADVERARGLLGGWFMDGSRACLILTEAIATALAQARDDSPAAKLLAEAVKLRGAIDCTGDVPVARGVLGEFALTKDGYVLLPGAIVFYNFDEGTAPLKVFMVSSDQCECGGVDYDMLEWSDVRDNEKCYSTRAAAKKARTDA